MSDESNTDWLKDLRSEVRSMAIAEALSDVPAPGDGSAATWIKRERQGDIDTETAFVLADGLLHRLSGQLEPEEREPAWEGTSKCVYDVLAISGQSSYGIRLERGRGGNDVAWTKRWWTFEFNPDETGLEIEYSEGTQTKQTAGPDPTPFARALVLAIAGAQTRANGNPSSPPS